MSKRATRWLRHGSPKACLTLLILMCLALSTLADTPATSGLEQRSVENRSAATSAVPRPFAARYRLEVKGWPPAYVDHRLSRDGDYWESLMKTDIRVARGSERGRFMLQNGTAQALYYASGYSLLGFGDNYQLGAEPLETLPDRQTALFSFSRRILEGGCAVDACVIRYLDHKGREEQLKGRIQGRAQITLPAGTFEAITVDAWESDKPNRRLLFRFHPEVPGLLLAVDYHRDGERRSYLVLSELTVLE